MKETPLLIIGEVYIDYTHRSDDTLSKLRLGGIVHAARALWAADIEFAVAAFCPLYLIESLQVYLDRLDCKSLVLLGEVIGCPNVILIGDPKEVSHQGYEDLLREDRKIRPVEPASEINQFSDAVIFPGAFDIVSTLDQLDPSANITIDAAYGIDDLSTLSPHKGSISTLAISTSSPLFSRSFSDDIEPLIDASKALDINYILLKENRGGSRLINTLTRETANIAARLSKTVNSVGVGDAFTAVMAGYASDNPVERAWRATQVATEYALSTYPDDIKRNARRELSLPLESVKSMHGISLPWHDREKYSIYLAGPDFSYVEKPELDAAVESLTYHNFHLVRPIKENGELERPAHYAELYSTYKLDHDLLLTCDVVFSVPLLRDPGTLVEVGMAIELGKPVITYDPRMENKNTMVMVGSSVYSDDLDVCINGVFDLLSQIRSTGR